MDMRIGLAKIKPNCCYNYKYEYIIIQMLINNKKLEELIHYQLQFHLMILKYFLIMIIKIPTLLI